MTSKFMTSKKFRFLAGFTLALTLQDGGLLLHLVSPQLNHAQAQTRPQSDPAQLDLQAEQQLEQGNYAAAIALFQQVRQLYEASGDRNQVQEASQGIAKAQLLKGDYAAALPVFQEAVAVARQNKNVGVERLLSLAGTTLYQMGRYAEAEVVLREAIVIWEAQRRRLDYNDVARITLIDQLSYAYRLLQKVLVAQQKTDAALEIAELSRARTLVQLLAQRRGEPEVPPPTLNELRQIAKAQNSTLVEYSIVGREIRVLNIEPRDETDLYIWVIAPNGKVTFRQVNLQAAGVPSLKALVLQTRQETIGVRGRGDGQTTAAESPAAPASNTQLQQLHRLLIQPIAASLPTNPNDRVTLIAESSLLLLPFAALQDPAGKHLIEQHTLLSAPSIQVLQLTRQQKNRQLGSTGNPQNVLVVGNPTMPRLIDKAGNVTEQLAALPGAEREARAIATLLKAQLLTGDAATKKAVLQRLPQAQIIHLATHGLLDLDANLNEFGELTVKPTRTARDSGVFIGVGVVIGPNVTIGGVPAAIAASREGVVTLDTPGMIAFAPSLGDNGFLSAKEIINLNLKASLVVLSACDTGRGRVTGDGVVGLARGFIAAGVPSVIVSLWSVPDAPTSSLMTEFYQNLQKNPDRAIALRQAMLTTMQQYPNPRNWAAFSLIGEA
jgi:CHAT domain-containing protein